MKTRRSLLKLSATAALLSAARTALPSGAFAQSAGPETKAAKLGDVIKIYGNDPTANMRPIKKMHVSAISTPDIADVAYPDEPSLDNDVKAQMRMQNMELGNILAGQVVMQGYIKRQIPLFLRRIITMVPSLVILAIGVNPSSALIVSQIALSFGIPFALIPLVMFCRDRELMGDLVNRRGTNIAAYLVVGVIVSLNVFLIYQTVLG